MEEERDVIIGKLNIEVTYTEGIEDDDMDVARVLRAAAERLEKRGHLNADLDMPVDAVKVKVTTEYKPETQQKLEFTDEEDEE
jgi:hypothetical protein